MTLSSKTCIDFIDVLGSKNPTPGGGAVAALSGAMGVALSRMVCNLTVGKKKYEKYEKDIKIILARCIELEKSLLQLIDKDAENFMPLYNAYSLPRDTQENKEQRNRLIEEGSKLACEAPIEIIKLCIETVKLHEELLDKGSKIVISDVGVGIQCLRAAIISARLNVLINLGAIKDEQYKNQIREEIDYIVEEAVKMCDKIYIKVEQEILG